MNEILWTADIHLNFFEKDEIEQLAAKLDAPVVISGDIAEGHNFPELLALLASAAGVPVYFVLGNHDLYGITRDEARAQAANVPGATYLSNRDEPVALTDTVALVGTDGWYDCRNGSYDASNLELADFRRIKDLEYCDRHLRLTVFQRWADDDSLALVNRVEDALDAGYAEVYAVTHVPPVPMSSRHEEYSGLPFYSNFLLGGMLKVLASRYPEQFVTVLAGHTHRGGRKQLAHNLAVYVSESDYEVPVLQRIPL